MTVRRYDIKFRAKSKQAKSFGDIIATGVRAENEAGAIRELKKARQHQVLDIVSVIAK